MSPFLFRERKHLGLAHLYTILDEGGKPVKSNAKWVSLLLVFSILFSGTVSLGILEWIKYSSQHPLLDVKQFWIDSKTGITDYTFENNGQNQSITYTSPNLTPKAVLGQLGALINGFGVDDNKTMTIYGTSDYNLMSINIKAYPQTDTAMTSLLVAITTMESLVADANNGIFIFNAEWLKGKPHFILQTRVIEPINSLQTSLKTSLESFHFGDVMNSDSLYTLRFGVFDDSHPTLYIEESFFNYDEATKILGNTIPSTWDSLSAFYNSRSKKNTLESNFVIHSYAGDNDLSVTLPEELIAQNNNSNTLPCRVYYAPPAAFCGANTVIEKPATQG